MMLDKLKRRIPDAQDEQLLEDLMEDAEFQSEYDSLKPRYDIIAQIIRARKEQNMTQAELAKQPTEKAGNVKDSEEYKACMEALKVAGEKLEYAEQLSFDKLKRVFKGDRVDDLFNDLTMGQLYDIHKQATRGK